jgi:hypothetical protein
VVHWVAHFWALHSTIAEWHTAFAVGGRLLGLWFSISLTVWTDAKDKA